MSPKVSIIMNCYNGEKFLKESLNSILKQSYKNWELIFWDNQSKDKSKKIFQSFRDKRFNYFYSRNHTNLYEARNLALLKAKGEIITFLDVDDIWLEDKLKKQVALFKNKKTNLVYGNYLIKNHYGFIKKKNFFFKKLPSGNITNKLLLEYCVGLLTIAIRRKSILKNKKVFNSKLNLISDFDFIINFSLKNKIFPIQEPIAIYRLHSNQQQRNLFYYQAIDFCKWYSNTANKKKFSNFSNYYKLKEKNKFYKFVINIYKKKFLYNFSQIVKLKNFRLKIKLLILLIFKDIAVKFFLRMH